MKCRNLVYTGAFSALSIVLSYLIHFPLIPSAPFLLYDPGDVPILIMGLKFSPGIGVVMTAIVSVLFAVLTGQGGPWGVLMHFIATGVYVLTASLIYRRQRNLPSAVKGLIIAPLVMTGVMVIANLLVTPLYLGVTREMVISMLLPAIIPFNLLKSAINGIITFLLYKKVSNFLEVGDQCVSKPNAIRQ